VGLAFLVLVGMAFLNSTRPAFACTEIWSPTIPATTAQPVTPSPATAAPATARPSGAVASPTPFPSATVPPPGLVQPDMGHLHETDLGATITYKYCPPASGKHLNVSGQGPIRGGLYGPNDRANPNGWIHNLEHGGVVLLYSCKDPAAEACTEAGQDKLQELIARWPNSPICNTAPGALTPVVARFDDMAWPYAALVWDVVLPMAQIDEPLLREFIARQAEQFNPEKLCADPTPTPGPTRTPAPATPTPGPTGTPGASAAPSGSTAPATTTAPSPS
jgi:hypothetical protein